MDDSAQEKKSGLQKKISSIFRGMPDLGEQGISSAPEAKPTGSPRPSGARDDISSSNSAAHIPGTGASSSAPESTLPPNPPFRDTTGGQGPGGKEREGGATQEFLRSLQERGTALKPRAQFIAPGARLESRSASIGADLGERQYKLLRLGKKATVEALAYWESAESVEFGVLEQEGSEILADMARDVAALGVSTTLGIGGTGVSYQILRFPPLPRAEMHKAVRWELSKKGLVPADSLMDFKVLSLQAADKKSVVLAVAAQESLVSGLLEEAQEAGLAVKEVATTAQALARVVSKGRLFGPGEDGGVLEIGFATSTLAFFRGSDLQYVRVFALGSKDFIAATTGTLRVEDQAVTLSPRDSEILLKVFGVPTAEMLRLHPAKAFLAQIMGRIRPVLEEFVEELRRSIQFYLGATGFGPVGTLYLSGGAGATGNLDRFLAQELSFTVKVLKPFDALGLDAPASFFAEQSGISQSSFTVALGLAMAGRYRFALMPGSYKRLALERSVTRWTKTCTACALIAMLIGAIGLQVCKKILEGRCAAVQSRFAGLSEEADKCRRILEITKTIREKEKLVIGNELRQPVWIGILKEISSSIGPNAMLTNLSLLPQNLPKTLSLQGVLYADNISVDAQLSGFMDKMTVSPFFASFRLVSRRRILQSESPASTFEIHGVLEY